MDIHTKYLCGHIFSFLWGQYLGLEWLGHLVNVCLILFKTTKLFSKVVVTFHVFYQ